MRRISAIITGAIVATAGAIALTGPPVTAEEPEGRTLTIEKVVDGTAPETSDGFVVEVACAEFEAPTFPGAPEGRDAFTAELPFFANGAADPEGLDVLPDEWSIIDGAWTFATTDLRPYDCTLTETESADTESVSFECEYIPAEVSDVPAEIWDFVCEDISDGRIQLPFGPFTETDACDVLGPECFDAAIVTITNVFLPTERVFGEDRYGTSVAMSEEFFPGGANTVYIATGQNFPDALALGVVAGLNNGPVLLVRTNSIPDDVLAEIRRLDPDTIIVAGGPAAVSEAVFEELEDEADTVERIGGADRYGTAAELSQEQFPAGADIVYIATGTEFADALAGVPLAGVEAGPVLLVRPGSVPDATAEELERLEPERIVILGGPAAISEDVADELEGFADTVDRLFGTNRYGTAVALSEEFFDDSVARVFLASGANFPDALSAGPVAIVYEGPILLSRPTCVPTEVLEEIERLDPNSIILVGGEAALSPAVAALEACPG